MIKGSPVCWGQDWSEASVPRSPPPAGTLCQSRAVSNQHAFRLFYVN